MNRRIQFGILALAVTLAAAVPPAAAQPGPGLEPPGPKAALALQPARTAFEPGTTAELWAVVEIEPGWHVNSHQPTFEYLIPTLLEVEPPPGWAEAAVSYPPGVMRTFAFEEQPLSVYEERAILDVELPVPDAALEQAVPVRAVLRYQACDDRSCLPPATAEASIELAVGAGGAPLARPMPAAPPAAPAVSAGRFALLLVLGLVGGLILNAMPCVLPVLSLKLFGLVKSAAAGRRAVVTGSLATAAGILISFWALAGAAVAARAAGATVGWGVQFQEPVFVTFLAVVVLLFSLNLWGLFEIPLPAWLGRVGGSSGAREGIAGHFASGLFATLMATPCSAPFLGTAIGFALSQSAGPVFAVFTAVGAGMALPYLALAVSPGAVRWLPKPGAWMDALRKLMGFLLAGAAVWLLYVLSSQMSRERLAFVELALLVLALAVWARTRVRRRGAVLAAGLVVLAAAISPLWLASGAAGPRPALTAEAESRLIPWVPFSRPEAERIAASGRPVFVDVTADWCFTCKVNERLVLETPEIAEAFERHQVVAMKADWTNRDEEIARFLADHGRYGIPFYLLYRPGGGSHLFGELLTKDEVVAQLERSAELAAGSGPASRGSS